MRLLSDFLPFNSLMLKVLMLSAQLIFASALSAEPLLVQTQLSRPLPEQSLLAQQPLSVPQPLLAQKSLLAQKLLLAQKSQQPQKSQLAQPLVLRHISPKNEQDYRNRYFIDLLILALSKTAEKDGPYKLIRHVTAMNQKRALLSLKNNYGVDIVWTMTSKSREQDYLPVRIPLLKGLLGYRIFLIRKEDQQRFAKISTLAQLKSLSPGQANGWPDTFILKNNGFDVVTGNKYSGLFKMLAQKRFDYFPRGMNEAWVEERNHTDLGLMVEPTIVVYYPAPIYFFVAKTQTILAKRITKGLLLAIGDGSFEQLFLNHPSNQEMFTKTKLSQRKIFRLENPLLPDKTPLKNEKLWYQIKKN